MVLPSAGLDSALTRGLPARFRDLENLAKKNPSHLNIVLCRSPSAEVAQEAFELGVWPLSKQTARKLWEIMAAQCEGFVVLVIALPASDYSTTGRGHYLGYGVAICPANTEEMGGLGSTFPEGCKVHWIAKETEVPYSTAGGLVNTLNNNYRIELTRDGFEVDVE
ncbi:hypothetical protein Pmar_PMAR003878 [Perkinsus marinus ATCC 50983]|uniref:YTH domain-containing protein n=1 Tax=Perkinsus marinus (strain ATCC 50983 / TXsc) TaxID=423536 RepID=C5KLT3_PERM5|nr:hypothetical protein Pmar_PMAR003878 [Perkinsus marinus ATCC 50983]EER14560.1 hypothetical protein Pmar_PMAR003878 [Perkinsus marinus ATCC 50983]|eukprot:XP_002782765.1 hypothetical protein Pmar_PMAR003878 [Perkinsus marinus ATCC 50983]